MNLPSQSGDDRGEDAVDEFVTRGTAISAPVIPLVNLAVAGLLALRRDRWGAVGAAGICLLSVPFVLGALSEATPDVLKAVLVTSGVVGAAIGTTLLALGVLELHRRWQQRSGS